MRLPKNALVVVADGERYLMLEPDPAPAAALTVTAVAERPVLRNVAIGTDRPGRYPVHGGRRETVENTDFKRLAKEDFARELAAELAGTDDRPIVLIAAPRTLGDLRKAMDEATAARVAHEIAADLTNHTVADIAAALAEA